MIAWPYAALLFGSFSFNMLSTSTSMTQNSQGIPELELFLPNLLNHPQLLDTKSWKEIYSNENIQLGNDRVLSFLCESFSCIFCLKAVHFRSTIMLVIIKGMLKKYVGNSVTRSLQKEIYSQFTWSEGTKAQTNALEGSTCQCRGLMRWKKITQLGAYKEKWRRLESAAELHQNVFCADSSKSALWGMFTRQSLILMLWCLQIKLG